MTPKQQEREQVIKLLETSPVCKRAYQNGYQSAKNKGKTERECIQAGRERAAKASRFIQKQRSEGN